MTTTLERELQPAEDPSTGIAPDRAWWRRIPLGSILVALAIAFVTVLPIAYLIINSFNITSPGAPTQYGFSNWTQAFDNPGIWDAVKNTVLLSIVRLVGSLIIGIPIAWTLARTNVIGAKAYEVLLWLSVFLPALPVTLGWILLSNPTNGLLNDLLRHLPWWHGDQHGPLNIYGFWGISWVHLSASSIPYMIVLTLPAFRRLDASFEDAVRTAGGSRLRALVTVTVPMLRPAIIGAAIIGLIYSFQSFEIELLIGTPVGLQVYSTEIYKLITADVPQYGQATVLGVWFIALLLLLVALYRRSLRDHSFETVTGRGFSDAQIKLRPAKRIGVALLLWAFGLVSIVLPIAFMVLGSFMSEFGFLNVPHPFTAVHWSTLIHNTDFTSAIATSLRIGLYAVVMGFVVYFILGWIVVRTKLRTRGLIDTLVWLPLAVPGLLLGLGMVWLFLSTPLRTVAYGTTFGLALALVVDHFAIGTQQVRSGLYQVSSELELSARVAGASRIQAARDITIPLVSPWLATVCILIFASALRNISTVVLLSVPGTQPLSLLLLDYSTAGDFETACAVGVLITFITLLFAVLARRLTRNKLDA